MAFLYAFIEYSINNARFMVFVRNVCFAIGMLCAWQQHPLSLKNGFFCCCSSLKLHSCTDQWHKTQMQNISNCVLPSVNQEMQTIAITTVHRRAPLTHFTAVKGLLKNSGREVFFLIGSPTQSVQKRGIGTNRRWTNWNDSVDRFDTKSMSGFL